MDIREKFNEISTKYDGQRRLLIRCFDDFYGLPIQALNFPADNPRVLDLGCGTGLFTALLLAKYPKARVTLVDIADGMLKVARERFADHTDFEYVNADFGNLNLSGPFDIIISGIAIHHIAGSEKKRLYKKCFKWLVRDGVFVNGDQIEGETEAAHAFNMRLWKASIETSGLPREEIDDAYERMKFDHPSKVSEQLAWLREIGFRDVDCIYKYLPLAVFYAKK
jgi:tRNA (cmo5U34)-methyltransferase